MIRNSIFLLLACVISVSTWASDEPKLVSVGIAKSFVPVGFDDNDRVQIGIEGAFADTCFTISATGTTVNEEAKTITLLQSAYHRTGLLCSQLPIPFHQTVNVGVLTAGTYTLKDGVSGRTLGELPVVRAVRPGPDDYIYAPVRDASVQTDGFGGAKLVLEGSFPNTCFFWRDIQVRYYGNVIVALPIVDIRRCENDRCICKTEDVPFEKEVTLNVSQPGSHFLHVRSINGQAINKMVKVRFDDPIDPRG